MLPTKFPPHVVKRLKKLAPVFEKMFQSLENADHRKETPYEKRKSRVKELPVKNSFSNENIILKKSHFHSAKELITVVSKKVNSHNARFKPEDYRLLRPVAYAIGNNLIAMPKIDRPSVCEILPSKWGERTERGLSFFEQLKKEHGVSEIQLKNAAESLNKRTSIWLDHMILLGVENGKFVFAPLLDVV